MIKAILRNDWTLPIFFTLILIGFNIQLNWTHFSSYPQSIHAWAQADYYAMAQKFYLDTWNLFEPQSWVMNKQFPSNWGSISDDTLTAGNIAIHPYIVGMLMRLFGTDAPIIYRMYCFLWILPFFIGLIQICKTLGSDRLIRLVTLIMSGLSPVFIYYSANFLNVIPCLGQTMIGLAFYFSFLKTNDRKSWWWAIVILGITPLIRTTYVIPLVAVLCTEGVRWLTKQLNFREFLKQIGGVCIFLGLLGIWFVWNNKMVEKHDTIFLGGLMQANNWQEMKQILTQAYDIWKGHYFNQNFVTIYLFIIALGVVLNRKRLMSNELAFAVILLVGYLFFLIAMVRQFKDHDYYFLDTLFIPLILLPVVIWKDYQFLGRFPIITFLIAIFFLKESRGIARQYHEWRYNLEFMDANRHNYEVYDGIAMYLEKNGVKRSEPIFVLSNMAPNLNLMHIRHNGVIARNFPEKLFRQAQEKGFTYFLIAKSEVGDDFYPLLKELKVIDSHGEVLVMTYNTDSEPWTLEAFKTY